MSPPEAWPLYRVPARAITGDLELASSEMEKIWWEIKLIVKAILFSLLLHILIGAE